MSAAFSFDSYKLAEVSYKPKHNNDTGKADGESKSSDDIRQYNIKLSYNTAVGSEKPKKYRMSLKICVTGYIEATINLFGFFSGTGFYENEKVELKELTPIAISLLMPIARSILASISAQDGSTPFMLPTVNVTEMLSQKPEATEILND